MLLDKYDTEGLFDEMFMPDLAVRDHYRLIHERFQGISGEELDQKIRSLETLFLQQGITFTVYGDDRAPSAFFPSTRCPGSSRPTNGRPSSTV